MDKIDWSKAPSDAEACIDGCFAKWIDGVELGWCEEGEEWVLSARPWTLARYIEKNIHEVEIRPDEWKEGAERMEQIAQNGNNGHYAELENNKSKYHREIKKGVLVDVYDVLSAFEVVNPAMQHALKKMLAPGKRGAKSTIQDMKEAMQSIERAIELEKEKSE